MTTAREPSIHVLQGREESEDSQNCVTKVMNVPLVVYWLFLQKL